jgi:Winged helix DNA-binding domain
VGEWNFLTNHAQALLCVARDPGTRLRDIAAMLGISERRAFGIVTDLADAGYVVKARDGRRNRYEIQDHLPLPDPGLRERTIGELVELLANAADPHRSSSPATTTSRTSARPRSLRLEKS